ncbi:hypothetical protein THAOC_35060 [Thalassiosira oceanica]|uniref:Uncharacterized protein n=1 Tax=Thalassiosira oceanica TaxID=159749 RepID=K0R3Z1_THAOC|nr:hypothetical protein THAOC_35060 [Thalassiosira oceanica]|eukprot:EJK46279.1 hypothetical protein THAOC_35060 [Thalassiosira oceanica]
MASTGTEVDAARRGVARRRVPEGPGEYEGAPDWDDDVPVSSPDSASAGDFPLLPPKHRQPHGLHPAPRPAARHVEPGVVVRDGGARRAASTPGRPRAREEAASGPPAGGGPRTLPVRADVRREQSVRGLGGTPGGARGESRPDVAGSGPAGETAEAAGEAPVAGRVRRFVRFARQADGDTVQAPLGLAGRRRVRRVVGTVSSAPPRPPGGRGVCPSSTGGGPGRGRRVRRIGPAPALLPQQGQEPDAAASARGGPKRGRSTARPSTPRGASSSNERPWETASGPSRSTGGGFRRAPPRLRTSATSRTSECPS